MEKIVEERLRGYLNRLIQTTGDLSERKVRDETGKALLPKRSYSLLAEKYVRLFLSKSLNQRIVLIPGLRGIGKTTLLFQIYRNLLISEKIPKEKLLYVDVGELTNNIGGGLDDLFRIYEEIFLKEPLEKTKDNLFIFLDEAHYSKTWPSFVKSLFDRSDGNKNVLIFVSGSSALALRSNTDLSRRAITDHLYPLSFQEYLLLRYNFYPPKNTSKKIRAALESDLESAKHILTTTFNSLQENISKSNINLENALIEYLSMGASPLSISGGPSDLYFRWWIGVLEKVVQQDIPSFSSISQKSSSSVFALLQFLAENQPSPHSLQNIAEKLNETSKTTVFNIFEALKNACLLIELNEDIDPLKKTNVSHKYYFMHPTIRAALLWGLGKFKKEIQQNDTEVLGYLLEDALASTLFKNKEIGNTILNVSYDDRNVGADFVIQCSDGKIGLECTWGKKSASQVKETIKRHSCKYGISVGKTNLVSFNENIITLPREFLLFLLFI